MLQSYHKALKSILNDQAALFRCQFGRTNVTKHVIDTGDVTTIKLLPRPIPFHYIELTQEYGRRENY